MTEIKGNCSVRYDKNVQEIFREVLRGMTVVGGRDADIRFEW